MSEFSKQFVLLFSVIFASMDSYAAPSENERYPDVRVVIDVSGSMKKNDPRNLRIPALKLLISLLPPESHAGVWLFDEDTEQLTEAGKIDEDWKTEALKSAALINSGGLYTDIEKALYVATKDWIQPQPDAKRNVLLLTDGVVDVSSNPKESNESRTRILEDLLPKLQQMSAHIHTIALSENADHALLKKIAFATDGSNESVTTADQLQRIFLKLFKKAVPRDRLPIVGNEFNIDSSIREFSLLVFRKPNAAETRLHTPENSEVSVDTNRENFKWQHEDGYDLITVQNPAAGRWKFVADTDPDNDVLILTDLKLRANDLPNYINNNEPLEIIVSLTDQGTVIVHDDFLNLVTVNLNQIDDLNRKRDWPLKQETDGSGLFKQNIGETLSPGQHTLTLSAIGKTFERKIDRTLTVVETPVQVEVSEDHSSEPAKLMVNIIPDNTVIDPYNMTVTANLTDSTGQSKSFDLVQKNELFSLLLDMPSSTDRWIVNFELSATSLLGELIKPQIKPLVIDGKKFHEKPQQQEAPAVDKIEQGKIEEPAPEPSSKKPNWVFTGGMTLLINIVIFALGLVTYRFIKNRERNAHTQLIARLST